MPWLRQQLGLGLRLGLGLLLLQRCLRGPHLYARVYQVARRRPLEPIVASAAPILGALIRPVFLKAPWLGVKDYPTTTGNATDDDVGRINLPSFLIEHHEVGLTDRNAIDDDRAVGLRGNVGNSRIANNHGSDRDAERDEARTARVDLNGLGPTRC